ncbi:MAG: histidinol-phosphatase [Planctomycetes bacterium]|nr:histidinol-phosphatase [Planctomycetota bacterium]
MGYQAVYHTHTHRCKHASGDAPDYARVAAAGGCRVLGISDHTPLPDGRWPGVRMTMDGFPGYLAAIAQARAEQPALTVLAAVECEWVPEFASFYRDELLGRNGLDYLIGAGHYTVIDGVWRGSFEHLVTPAALRTYATMMEEAMVSGLFAFIAHPDLIGCCNEVWTADTAACARDLCAASLATGVPLELNGYGIRKEWIDTPDGRRPQYPWIPFWEIAGAMGVQVVLNSDAHRPEDTLAGYDDLVAIRDRFALVEADLSRLTAQH